MPRTVPLLAGVIVVSTITYKFRQELLNDTSDLKKRLDNARSSLENVTSSSSTNSLINSPHQSILPKVTVVDDSKKYVSERLIPSVKHSWNDQVAQVAHNLVHTDYTGKAKQTWEKVKKSME